jgi:hypothetical protein
VIIAKTAAPDDGVGGGTACDGVADGPFAENVTVDQKTCVVYQICVTNTGLQVLDSNGVKVSDPVLGTVNLDFGTNQPRSDRLQSGARCLYGTQLHGRQPRRHVVRLFGGGGRQYRYHHFRRLSGEQPERLCSARFRLLGHGQRGLPRAGILPHDRWTQFRCRGRHVQ